MKRVTWFLFGVFSGMAAFNYALMRCSDEDLAAYVRNLLVIRKGPDTPQRRTPPHGSTCDCDECNFARRANDARRDYTITDMMEDFFYQKPSP